MDPLDAAGFGDTSFLADLVGETQDKESFPAGEIVGSISPAGDVDWYAFIDSDSPDPVQPRPSVEVDELPPGLTLEVCLFYECDQGNLLKVNCETEGGWETTTDGYKGCCWGAFEEGDVATIKRSCSLIDDGGIAYVRLQASGGVWSCEDYVVEWGDEE